MAWGAGEGVRCNPGRKDTELESAQQPGLGFTQRSFAYGLSVSTTETQAGMWGSSEEEVSVLWEETLGF